MPVYIMGKSLTERVKKGTIAALGSAILFLSGCSYSLVGHAPNGDPIIYTTNIPVYGDMNDSTHETRGLSEADKFLISRGVNPYPNNQK